MVAALRHKFFKRRLKPTDEIESTSKNKDTRALGWLTTTDYSCFIHCHKSKVYQLPAKYQFAVSTISVAFVVLDGRSGDVKCIFTLFHSNINQYFNLGQYPIRFSNISLTYIQSTNNLNVIVLTICTL